MAMETGDDATSARLALEVEQLPGVAEPVVVPVGAAPGGARGEGHRERVQAALASLQEAAKKVNRAVAGRAVEAQPDAAVPLIQEIGSALQQLDRAVVIKLPTAD
ncbi:hypothetical protein [Streptomyces sp. YS415]|uniref:hypothetical protein n=1 Tax=Streptomyces sp. YS415 TaxID=2944806 RepID=UPI0020217141|nr:hypothetical protein [Streptomyces sp. YS415]MCL7428932.1 hypothetical protein [Streptomyces sp. YS415]